MSEKAVDSRLMAIGQGYDIHRLVSGSKLFLGGVQLEHQTGLEGHSDADVLLHAIMDALLGAAGAGDIGHLFPNTDERWRDASSLDLLDRVRQVLETETWTVGNVDATVIAETPKLSPHVDRMRVGIAKVLRVDPRRVNLKATTAEGVGPEGRGEAISAHAVALLLRK